ncbi:hypothetical protein C8Q74DRAFT_899219 [Fomes fomentarius]|nr:hypothetical protein C8Q74DRAFT_899219 [Fomes fomentarius]
MVKEIISAEGLWNYIVYISNTVKSIQIATWSSSSTYLLASRVSPSLTALWHPADAKSTCRLSLAILIEYRDFDIWLPAAAVLSCTGSLTYGPCAMSSVTPTNP